ncbi:MAG: hypothetical protein RL375_4906 [Pseudomonadota bacterium]
MRAGELRHQVAVQTVTIASDTTGSPVETWATSSTVWGSVEPLRGREYFAAHQIHADATHMVRIRYLSTLTREMRFLFGSRALKINEIRNVDERGIYQDCLCTEVL